MSLAWVAILVGCRTTPPETAISPYLTEPLRFANFTVTQIKPEEVSRFISQRVYIGTEDPAPDNYNWLVSEKNPNRFHCETVNEYRAAKKGNYYAATTADMVVQEWFDLASDTLDFMANAKPSQHSYLGDYFIDLPVSILSGRLDGSDDDLIKKDAAEGKTLKDYTKNGSLIHLGKLKVTGNSMIFTDQDNDYDYLVKELARGDFDGDGDEDALVLIAGHTLGTLGWSGTCIVTKTGPNRKLKLVAK